MHPAKLRALLSSAALVVNVFEYFVRANPQPLLDVLGIEEALARPLSFEAEQRYPIGLPGNPPNLDVALELRSGAVVGIESKFTEWLGPKHGSKLLLKDKYFDRGAQWWRDCGLPRCQALAAALKSGDERCRHLDAPQLLKHALGLAAGRRGGFALLYLYYDVPGRASRAQRDEIARFAAHVGDEIGFRALTYQAVYAALRASDEVDREYLRYLSARYFS
jgi:hypothetical protein